MTTFLHDKDRRSLQEIVGGLVEERALKLNAFCLMPTHYHLLVSTPGGGPSRWMRHVNGDHVRWVDSGHGRYRAILVQGSDYLSECSRYIHLNPNRARITRPAERYKWSSYRNYVAGPRAVEWVETPVVLERFSGERGKYKRYVEAGKDARLINSFERATAGLVLGSEERVKRIRKIVRSSPDIEEQPSRRVLLRKERVDRVRVEETVSILFADSGAARSGPLLLYPQRMHSSLRPEEIGPRCGRPHSVVVMAVRSVEAVARTDAELAVRLCKSTSKLQEE